MRRTAGYCSSTKECEQPFGRKRLLLQDGPTLVFQFTEGGTRLLAHEQKAHMTHSLRKGRKASPDDISLEEAYT